MSRKTQKWINREGSYSTVSVATWHGAIDFGDGLGAQESAYIEMGDCQRKVRPHLTMWDGMPGFIAELDALENEVRDFKQYLQNVEAQSALRG